MADLAAALMSLYTQLSYPEIDPREVVLKEELGKYSLDVDQDTMRDNLALLSDRFSLAESSRNPRAEVDAKGKAKGAYQWLTEDPYGEGQPAFQTALNRMSAYYKKRGKEEGRWVTKAKEHNDPTKLTKLQQEALFFADIFQRKGTTTDRSDLYPQGKLQEIMKTGNPDVMMDLYLKDWHTKPSDMSPASWQKVIDNARRSFY